MIKIKDYRIIAVRGTSDKSYFLVSEDGKKAMILSSDYLTKPRSFTTILRQGYWKKYEPPDNVLKKLYKKYLNNIKK